MNRKVITAALAAMLVATGGSALAKPKPKTPKAPTGFADFSAGGAAGTFDDGPARPARPVVVTGPGWKNNFFGGVVSDASKVGVALVVGCEGQSSGRSLYLDVKDRPDTIPYDAMEEVTASLDASYNRLITPLRSATVTINGPGGVTTIALTRSRDRASGHVSWSKTLTASDLGALKASSSITLATDRWQASFSGRGAARSINSIDCGA